ncbi:MAG: EamA family transporter [Gemmatimonadota bacterium]|jgi:multidrug transporter EmrE-like cation transporter|nr:EamA family transporter [Gemmatimonadota bacterium]MDP6802725.1 EamA family transporter [Gemmatimonadota bacterium]MDP7031754.1 EamA family transporter [Gemmatimonadota bacterium]
MRNVLLILVCVALGVCGQLLLKHGMSSPGIRVTAASQIPAMIGRAIATPSVVSGFLFYGLSSVLWLVILTRVELSMAYPMLSIGYVLVVFLSRFFFHEHVTPMRILGTLVVCLGVFLISRSQ